MRFLTTLPVAALVSTVTAEKIYTGFNTGATDANSKVKVQADFEKEFKTAQALKGSPGVFSSARLYTNVQGSTTDTPIEAFPAAIATNTSLLLGIWCSGVTNITNELNALTKAIDQYGSKFTDLVVGLSVGSEDLYRTSVDGIKNDAGVGQDPDTIIGFIDDARSKLKGTALSSIPIGHVDTWNVWTNSSITGVIEKIDFVGMNTFPYYESNEQNDFSNASFLFWEAYNATAQAAGNKPVWVTETGWPLTGPDFGQGKASVANAEGYWGDIGCSLFGKKNVWWYELVDSNPVNKPKFGITTADYSTTAQFNLTCSASSGAPTASNGTTVNGTQSGSTGSATASGTGAAASSSNKPGAATTTGVSWVQSGAAVLSVAFAMVAWA